MTKPTYFLLSFGCAGLLSSGAVGCLSLEPLDSYAEGEPSTRVVGADAPLEIDPEATAETSTAELEADAGAPPGDSEATTSGGGESVLEPAALGLEPAAASAASCSAPGEFMDDAQQSCYLQGQPAVAWTDARQGCQSWGGELVTIDSPEEDDFLAARLDVTVWIGASDRLQEGRVVGLEGAPLPFTNWASGQPDDFQNREDCVVKQANSGAWNDLPCGSPRSYVCERADG